VSGRGTSPAARSTGPIAGAGGLPKVVLHSADGASAEVYLHGAHVTSWRPAHDGEERLYLSPRSSFRPGQAIRGGIPVIFPQFAAEGPLPRHGFARTTEWTLAGVEETEEGGIVASLVLQDSPATRAIWPVPFHATLTVGVVGSRLEVGLAVDNLGTTPISFTAALHTYLRVRDVADAEVVGLQGTRYRESSAPGVLREDGAPSVRLEGEIDRVYADSPARLVLREGDRALQVEAAGFRDTVLWNPGSAKAAALADLEPGGERAMVCVEAASVQEPVVLDAARRWRGTQTLDAAPRNSNEERKG
jgi:glucose-6-phosphate 1-epimerase